MSTFDEKVQAMEHAMRMSYNANSKLHAEIKSLISRNEAMRAFVQRLSTMEFTNVDAAYLMNTLSIIQKQAGDILREQQWK